ncbi:MAG: hypothetical protein LQ349_007218, partial [Xanthoria aureola]
ARLHVVIWYLWLSVTVTFLAVRAFRPKLQKALAKQIYRRKLPVVNRSLTVGAAVMISWIVALYALIIGIWWPRLHEYFVDRSLAGGIRGGGDRLAAIALTGHMCDVTMGMVLVPISRHSALASFFQLSVSTTLTLHMLSAYTLFALVLIHSFLYISWAAFITSMSAHARKVLPVLNPTYLYHETWPGNTTSLGVWRASLVFTGLFAVIVMLVISITTLPKVRRKHFNLFYFTHLFSILMVIVICLHASTILYCTAPGLVMWCLDWSMRLHELKLLLYGELSTFGNGWYCITVPIPRSRLAGCSCRSPLAHFFIHHGDSSTREVHPFTTITHLATKDATTPAENNEFVIQFLFRKVGAATPDRENKGRRPWLSTLTFGLRREPRKSAQWTEKIASSLDHEIDQRSHACPERKEQTLQTSVDLALRLEGPYFSPADPSRYHTVVCLVAGTGVSGALAIAGAFSALQTSRPTSASGNPKSESSEPVWRRCVIVWSVRENDYIDLLPLMPTSDVELQSFYVCQVVFPAKIPASGKPSMARSLVPFLLLFSSSIAMSSLTHQVTAGDIGLECWPGSSILSPTTFKECVDAISKSLTPRGADPDIPLKFSKDLKLNPDFTLPNFWKSWNGDCIIGIDFERGVGGYDRTSLNDIKHAALAVARRCVIPPPHLGGTVHPLGWQGKLVVSIGGLRARADREAQ